MSSGLLSLASGEAKNRKRIIFYFTGTGNISVSNSYLLFQPFQFHPPGTCGSFFTMDEGVNGILLEVGEGVPFRVNLNEEVGQGNVVLKLFPAGKVHDLGCPLPCSVPPLSATPVGH